MSTNPNALILGQAWALLFDRGSACYLPAIMQHGATFDAMKIPPLTSLAVPDQDGLPLTQSSAWGDVEISLTSIAVAGLPSIRSVAFAADVGSVSAVVAFEELTLAGRYTILGTGTTRSAIDLADLQGRRARKIDDDPSLDLAKQYRAQLVQTPNGTTMVSTYYDHNDTMTFILNNPNAFSAAWPNAHPTGPKTSYYMGVTTDGAANPDVKAGIGEYNYDLHAFYMQTTLLGTALKYANGSTDPDNPYYALATDTVNFKNATQPHSQTATVNGVMDVVQNASPPQGLVAATEEPEVVRTAREMAERDFAMWEERAHADEAARASRTALVTPPRSQGSFTCSFAMPRVTLTGAVRAGTLPHEPLAVEFTQLVAAVPDLDVRLLTGNDAGFTADVQTEIDNAAWFRQVVGTQVRAQLASAGVLRYLSAVLDQAIADL